MQIDVTFTDVVCKAAVPVIIPEVVQIDIFHLLGAVLVERIFAALAIAEYRPVTVVHAEQQHDAVAFGAFAHVVLVVDGISRLIDAVLIVVAVVSHRHDVNTDAVLLCDALRHLFKLLAFAFSEKSGRIGHMVKLRAGHPLRRYARAEGKHRDQGQQEAK